MQTYFPRDSSKTELLKTKSSFKDFSQAYFKTANDIVLNSNIIYEFSKIGNENTNGLYCKICKNSSATKNFDVFLKKSQFAKFEQEAPFQYTEASSKKGSNKPISSINSNNSYYHRTYSEFPAHYSDMNPLVTFSGKNIRSKNMTKNDRIDYDYKSKKYYHENELFSKNDFLTTLKEKKFLDEKVLCTPKEKYNLFLKYKQELADRKESKIKFLNFNKQKRIIKEGYKSGILSVDNPENEFTTLYRVEFEKNLDKKKKNEQIKERNWKNFDLNFKTDSDIEFFNKTFRENQINKETIKIPTFFQMKKNVKGYDEKYKNSTERLFGEPMKEERRFAKRCLTAQKEFDIISQKKNQIY